MGRAGYRKNRLFGGNRSPDGQRDHFTERDMAFLCSPGRSGSLGDLRGQVRNRRGGIEGLFSNRDLRSTATC